MLKPHVFPSARAMMLGREVWRVAEQKIESFVRLVRINRYDELVGLCRALGIHLRCNEEIPGGLHAITLDVSGAPFIVLNRSIAGQPDNLAKALAHELGHRLLGHCMGHAVRTLTHVETMNAEDATLQELLKVEIEVEATLLGMMLIVPDTYLHAVVQQREWIPTEKTAAEYGFDKRWMAARVHLYRGMHGYRRSEERLAERLGSDWSGPPDLRKWVKIESAGCAGLPDILPTMTARAFALVK